jgi:hypothetical protein
MASVIEWTETRTGYVRGEWSGWRVLIGPYRVTRPDDGLAVRVARPGGSVVLVRPVGSVRGGQRVARRFLRGQLLTS